MGIPVAEKRGGTGRGMDGSKVKKQNKKMLGK